jgi:F-type H+-transporting ATPase subunit delta
MAESITLARPYAMAAFALAKRENRLADWSQMLRFAADLYRDERVQAALANPKLTRRDVEALMLDLVGERLDERARNLLVLLVRNNRLHLLPSIAELYEQLRAVEENQVDAQIETAFPLSDAQLGELVGRLERRTARRVRARVELEPELIGGVRVRIGDDVWDASVRGQLASMSAALTR